MSPHPPWPPSPSRPPPDRERGEGRRCWLKILRHFGASALFCLVLASPTLAAPDPAAHPYRRIVERADVLVTVEFVLKVKMAGAGADREVEGETTCPLIDAGGLVLCSNTELGGYVGLMSQMMGRGGGFELTAAPREIKVVLDEGGQGLDGRLIARDTERDLAWVQIDGGAESLKRPFLDLSDHTELGVGDRFYRLRRLGEFFGSVPVVSEGVVAAVVEKPRRLLVPAAPAGGGFGLPVFDAAGTLVGVTVIQMPAAEDRIGADLAAGMSFLGSAARLQDMVGGLILPAADLLKATRLAREVAAEGEEE